MGFALVMLDRHKGCQCMSQILETNHLQSLSSLLVIKDSDYEHGTRVQSLGHIISSFARGKISSMDRTGVCRTLKH